jgi:hypothetical protein
MLQPSHRLSIGLLAPALLCSIAQASAITNGSFELGGLDGWSTFEANTVDEGAWVAAQGGSILPLSSGRVPMASHGEMVAISDMAAAGLRVLYQDITIPENGSLSFDLWWRNTAGFWENPGNMFPEPFPNQHARIDLIATDAPLNTTDPADITRSLVLLDSGDTESVSWVSFSFDLSDLAGQTLRLRIAEVDNQAPLYVAVDNFVLVPSPGTIPLALLTLCLSARRRR